MTILRIHKKKNNFVILDKTCLHDEKLSWGAKGLHAYLIALPDDWQVRVKDLQKRASNGRDAVRNLLNELEQSGYIKKSICRSEETGRFGGMEFLVLESPELKTTGNSPETGKPSAAKNALKSPVSENPFPVIPATGNPSTENPTLININRINNNKLNNKTAALGECGEENKAAAVNFQRKIIVQSLEHGPHQKAQFHVLAQEDALIGEALTPNQYNRVLDLMKKLALKDKDNLFSEIQYCLLNKKHFTGCGNEFSKKLNAIRAVILRGDWQTPVGMLVEEGSNVPSKLSQLQQFLKEGKAEEAHFKRLYSMAKEDTKEQLIKFVGIAQQKIKEIETLIAQETATNNVLPISCNV
ncbi:MAG: replication protein [Legionella sp.]|nr:replication protein [Legionella sp.]